MSQVTKLRINGRSSCEQRANISVKPFASLTGTAQKRGAFYLGRYAAKAEHRGHGIVAAFRPLR